MNDAFFAEWDEKPLDDEMNRVPDAFVIDAENQTVRAFEVNESNPLDEDRLYDYAWLWFSMDCHDIDLEVVEVDRYLVEHRVPLMELYYTLVLPESVTQI